MFIPIATSTSVHRTPWANYALLGANILVYILLGRAGDPTPLGKGLLAPLILKVADLHLHQFVSYQFLHGGLWHLAGNMLFLWIFGNAVNAKMGNGPYLLFYLAGGVAAAIGQLWIAPASMVGASGAIAAVTTAYLVLFPRSDVTVLYWWFFIGKFEIRSMYLIIFKMILWDNLLAPSMIPEGQSNVAFEAHLAGYAFGFAATVLLLLVRILPRDQFDLVALSKRSLQRKQMRSAMADPNAQARAQLGRVARPVSVRDVPRRSPHEERIIELRGRISDALGRGERDGAARLYEEVLELDARQVLTRTSQLEVAYHYYTSQRSPQAAAAYEKYLSNYPNDPQATEVELLLGIIYARDLQQYEVAKGHLERVHEQLTDDKRIAQCRHWLDVVHQALRPADSAGTD